MAKLLQLLTIPIAALAGVACAGGLMIPGLYRDDAFYKAAWQANDLITLVVTPVVLISYHHYTGGNARAHLLWLGLLLYMFYNYAFYLFGAAFNWFFIIYASLFTLTLYALLIALREVDNSTAQQAVDPCKMQADSSVSIASVDTVGRRRAGAVLEVLSPQEDHQKFQRSLWPSI